MGMSTSCLNTGECETQGTWVIAKAIQPSLEDIKGEELLDSLKDLGVSAKIELFENYFKHFEVLKGKHFTIYLAPSSFSQDHVWIMANQQLSKSFEALDTEQLTELEKFRYLMGEAYQHSLGYQGYIMFMDLKKDYGLGRSILCLEMIPAALKGLKHNQLDIREKIERTKYFLLGTDKLHSLNLKEAKDKVERLKTLLSELQAKNHTLETQQRITKNTLPWTRRITHMQDLKQAILQELKGNLLNRQALLIPQTQKSIIIKPSQQSLNNNNDGEFTEDVKESVIEKCTFCNPNVIKNQFVHKHGDFVILYNFRPYALGYHFMITPHHPLHIEDWQDFSLPDSLHIIQLAQAVVTAIKKESGRDDIILFTQNGLAAGMTVPHAHMHVLLRPSHLHLMAQVLLEISNHKRKGLTSEEMDPVKEKFGKQIRNLLN